MWGIIALHPAVWPACGSAGTVRLVVWDPWECRLRTCQKHLGKNILRRLITCFKTRYPACNSYANILVIWWNLLSPI